MPKSQPDKDRQEVLRVKDAAHAANSSNPALTPAERVEYDGLVSQPA